MNRKQYVGLLILLLGILISKATASDGVKFDDFASKKIEIVGRLDVPIGRVVRVEAMVISADKVWPGSKLYQEAYLLSIHAIDGREVHDLITVFEVHGFAVTNLFRNRGELTGKLKSRFKRNPTAAETAQVESTILSAGKRTFLVYESIVFDGVPVDMPPDVTPWSGTTFGPVSKIIVIHEMNATK